MRVLLIDNDDQFCEKLGNVLTDCGFVVKALTDAKIAAETAEDFRPDIVVLDWELGPTNPTAPEVEEALRKTKSCSKTPIFLASRYNTVTECQYDNGNPLRINEGLFSIPRNYTKEVIVAIVKKGALTQENVLSVLTDMGYVE